MSADFGPVAHWGERLLTLRTDAADLLDPLLCKQPGGVGGSQPGVHCAECCMGTGFAVTCEEEHDVATALEALVRAVDRLADITVTNDEEAAHG